MNYQTKQLIVNFVTDNLGAGPMVSNYQIARSFHVARHLRSGIIRSGEGKGTIVHALYYDELGNTIALCKDGIVRQFY